MTHDSTFPVAAITIRDLKGIIGEAVRDALAAVDPRSPDEILSTQQLAKRWGKHPKTIAILVRQQGLPAHRLGGASGEYRFRVSEVEAWLSARKAGAK